ncbi:MAG: lipoate--protein ligase [Candidatus Saccharibacteria bacterium]
MITLCLQPSTTDPYFNLAAEEYFLKQFQQDIFMLWRSVPSVVVGKHQNALAEINHAFVDSHQIPVARRLSGGGTVFHDLGNLNFTFIRTVDKIQEINFKIFTFPIVEALRKAGIEATTTGRNDLLIEGKKISGNAAHVHKNRVLFHGTLLYNSQLDALKGALNTDLSRFEDKSVQSNRSEVTNIVTYLDKPLSVEDFSDRLFEDISKQLPGKQLYFPNAQDAQAIRKLSDEKYRTWEWIYGYSPRYRFNNRLILGKDKIDISLLVEKGLLTEVAFLGPISAELKSVLENALLGCPHDLNAIKGRLMALNGFLQDAGIEPAQLAGAMF